MDDDGKVDLLLLFPLTQLETLFSPPWFPFFTKKKSVVGGFWLMGYAKRKEGHVAVGWWVRRRKRRETIVPFAPHPPLSFVPLWGHFRYFIMGSTRVAWKNRKRTTACHVDVFTFSKVSLANEILHWKQTTLIWYNPLPCTLFKVSPFQPSLNQSSSQTISIIEPLCCAHLQIFALLIMYIRPSY